MPLSNRRNLCYFFFFFVFVKKWSRQEIGCSRYIYLLEYIRGRKWERLASLLVICVKNCMLSNLKQWRTKTRSSFNLQKNFRAWQILLCRMFSGTNVQSTKYLPLLRPSTRQPTCLRQSPLVRTIMVKIIWSQWRSTSNERSHII